MREACQYDRALWDPRHDGGFARGAGALRTTSALARRAPRRTQPRQLAVGQHGGEDLDHLAVAVALCSVACKWSL